MKNLLKKTRRIWKVAMTCALAGCGLLSHAQTNGIPNPLIDYDHFLAQAAEVGRLRDQRRVTEEKWFLDVCNG